MLRRGARERRDAFEKKGINALATAGTEEANQVLNSQPIEYLFVDCLLPGMSGDEFVIKVKRDQPDKKFKVILMSGIYTDKSTIQDLLKKTQATAFLKKHFDLEQVLSLVKSAVEPKENPLKSLYHIFSKENLTTREKRKIIDSVDEISGYDLPFIYSLLAETKSSGYLNIYFNETNVSGITFSNGCILGDMFEDLASRRNEVWRRELFARSVVLNDGRPGEMGFKVLWEIAMMEADDLSALSVFCDSSLYIDGKPVILMEVDEQYRYELDLDDFYKGNLALCVSRLIDKNLIQKVATQFMTTEPVELKSQCGKTYCGPPDRRCWPRCRKNGAGGWLCTNRPLSGYLQALRAKLNIASVRSLELLQAQLEDESIQSVEGSHKSSFEFVSQI